ncbi:TetR/AcrR family transcriptional regulator [Cognatiyoonia sp. IB215182]|uniref:TetR/AcrR family transcriptional regulator n=1 Tax=Cognatiyoonia sp. IB215182 TaxID=3097353 RepID=UPI002A116CC5|nr:TetR/AcrR family transcriptional regulator [Cognatiyoonia sp. IB215182]MDX8351061.1 TetR/AcrR family transcriptional regulator [Cognatiyoonia sp. IB215182]
MTEIRPSTRDAIIEAAFAVFSENQAASLGDVAQRAGVGRATLHRHFPGRAELMRALAKTALAELEAAVEQATAHAESYEEGFRLSLMATVPLANRQWFLAHEGLEADPEIAAAYSASLDALRQDVEEAKKEGAFDSHVPTAWIVEAYENLTYTAWSLVRSGEATPKQAAELAWRTLSQGLKGGSQ